MGRISISVYDEDDKSKMYIYKSSQSAIQNSLLSDLKSLKSHNRKTEVKLENKKYRTSGP